MTDEEIYARTFAMLVCEDAAKAADFYTAAFGVQEIRRQHFDDGKISLCILQFGEGFFTLQDEDPETGAIHLGSAKVPGLIEKLTVETDQMDAVAGRVSAHGGLILHGPEDTGEGYRKMLVSDGQAHLWTLWQRV